MFTPTYRAAFSFPPTAYTDLPKYVCLKIQAVIRNIMIAYMIGNGIL